MVNLPQFKGLVKLDDDLTDERYGHNPDRRPLPKLLDYGVIALDKPPGPTSHEIVAWVRKMLKVEKAGHSGTLDPPATGLLPVGLGEGTKALGVLLLGPKEYHAITRLHAVVSGEAIGSAIREFSGDIYQRPPQRSAVKRDIRVRSIYELELLEQEGKILAMRILCQAGTYIRKLIYDMGEILGAGATMVELRRTRVSNMSEDQGLVRMHDLADAFTLWQESGKEEKLREIVKPVELVLEPLKAVMIRDTAVDALCHGAQLALPGVLRVSRDLKKGDFVGVYTLKGELVALAEAALSVQEMRESAKGIAFTMRRIIMKPGTYPKAWRARETEVS